MYDFKSVQNEYRSKLISAEFAAGLVRRNYRIHFGIGTGCSVYMDKALGDRLRDDPRLEGIEIQTEIAIRNDDFETYKAAESPDRVRFYSTHFSGIFAGSITI